LLLQRREFIAVVHVTNACGCVFINLFSAGKEEEEEEDFA